MNRRHMMGDHDGQSVGRATLLVRAVDVILGTHRCLRRRLARGAGYWVSECPMRECKESVLSRLLLRTLAVASAMLRMWR